MQFNLKKSLKKSLSIVVKSLFLSIIPMMVNAQDEPGNAFTADPLTGCLSVTVDPGQYTPSAVPGPAGCAGNSALAPKPDVWVLLNVPASGTLFLNPQGTVDAGMAAYTYDAGLGTYTLLGCDDDTGPGLMPQLTITTVPAGTPVYIQLWAYSGGVISFSFCSSDCTTPAPYNPDNDGDGVGSNATIYTCTPDPNWLTTGGDCDDTSPAINNTLPEFCNDGLDNDCNGQVDEGCTTDLDGDGYLDAQDCAPNNPNINPGAQETCNSLDENCNGIADDGLPTTSYYMDLDADGFGTLNAYDLCYDINNPPFCAYSFNMTDTYGDGWNGGSMDVVDVSTGSILQSVGTGFTTGFAASEAVVLMNNMTYSLVWTTGGAYPQEMGLDLIDPSGAVIYNLPSGSTGSVGSTLVDISVSCPAQTYYIFVSGDCDDTNAAINSNAAELCDFIDNNCDTQIDEGCAVDADADGYDVNTDCDDNNPSINPGAAEICDYLDNNCNIEIDEFVQLTFYSDFDGDGFGDNNNTVFDCSAPFGYTVDNTDCDDFTITYVDADGDGWGGLATDPCGVTSNTDCNDGDGTISPVAAEICGDAFDNNCDGTINEGCVAIDNDGDGFDSVFDCNDNCATVYPGAVCNDNNPTTEGETIQADCSCGGGVTVTNCLGAESITFNPAPVGGTWPVGTTVEVCYTLNYAQATGDWLDGMAVTLGTGWGTPTGTIAPNNCNGGVGAWNWQVSNTPTSTFGVPTGYGWYFDYTIDGNGGNDWGDAGSCTFNMCFSSTTVSDIDLSVSVSSGGDSYFGSYSAAGGCPLTPFTVDPATVITGCQLSFPYCATASACDPITNIYSLTAANSNLIQMLNPPSTGTLDISLDGVLVQSFTAPFAANAALNIANLVSDGATHTITATFSDSPGCTATTTYVAPASCSDGDGDGFEFTADCNDANPTIYPGAPEICGNGLDDNCDNVLDEGCGTDVDGDGFDTTVDCNDNDFNINPGATEVCADGIDNNCNGCIEENCGTSGDEPCTAFTADPLTGCIDVTVDPALYTPSVVPGPAGCAGNTTAAPKADAWILLNVPASGTLFLNPQGTVDAGMAAYTYDAITQTYSQLGCDDDTGPGLMPQLTLTAPAGTAVYVQLWAYGGGTINFSFCSSDCTAPTAYYTDVDADGFGNNNAIFTCTPDASWITTSGDCNDNDFNINPLASEICNDAIDNNCEGQVDEGCATDFDGDGFVTAEDCDDNNPLINAGIVEICDGIDNNCDALIDENFNVVNFYFDGDLDGFGDPNVSLLLCDQPLGYITDNTDCNDVLATINPSALDICTDALDNDCNGVINDNCVVVDNDADGFDIITDCNDNCATIYPGAVCNDNNPATEGETIQPDCTCGGGTLVTNCLGAESITFNPAPVGGTWPVGTTVEVCYTLNYAQATGDWLDGMAVTLGTGWGTPTGTIAPANCGGGAPLWIWQTSNTPTSTFGVPTGYGWYYDTNSDGNGGNDFGDAGSCTFNMCFSAATVSDVDLWVGVSSGGDSYFGSYSAAGGCPLTPFTVDPVNVVSECQLSFPYCITPSLCDPATNSYGLTSGNSNFISLVNPPLTGSLEISLDGTVVQTINPPFNSSYALEVVGLTSDGLLHTISAAFTASTCAATIDYLSPVPCAIIDEDLDGFANTNDCNDNNASVYPGATEVCDDLDNNCEGSVDEGLAFNTYYMDMDGDGFGVDAVDLCYDPANPLFCGFTFNLSDDFNDGWNLGYLDVLNGVTGAVVQTIGEEFTTGATATEIALLGNGMSYDVFWTNGGEFPNEMGFELLDPSGNILTTLAYFSAAQVGSTLYSLTVSCPAETMYVQINGDCDDANAAAYPGAEEICDVFDNNCDNTVDEGFDADSDGFSSCGGDCDDTNASINPAAPEVCGDAVDNNCNGNFDETTGSIWYIDNDGDGLGSVFSFQISCVDVLGYVTNFDDCNDADPTLTYYSVESCDGLDNDCDGNIDNGFDLDNDGFTTCQSDCNDNNAAINPSVIDVCENGIDEDCSGTDAPCGVEGCTNASACNFDPLATIDNGSCVLPSVEICDGVDNDCNGVIDNGLSQVNYYIDADGDGFGDANAVANTNCAQPTGYVADNTDCLDSNPAVNPNASEECGDGIDNNCNGNGDETAGATWYADVDGDGFGNANASTVACIQPNGYVANSTDCNDNNAALTVSTPEVCDGLDNDCNGVIDNGLTQVDYFIDADGDGFGDANAVANTNCAQPTGYVADNTDCLDSNPAVNSNASEVCGDGIDNNCNGSGDENSGAMWYADVDGDGYGNLSSMISACTQPVGYVANSTDCNDNNAALTVSTPEVCDGIDNDCNGLTDNGLAQVDYFIDADGDGFGDANGTPNTNCAQPTGYVANATDCDDAAAAVNTSASEICDAIDNDCDGQTDEGFDVDADGFTACQGDCNDNLGSVNPGASEVCGDNVDNNCNGNSDETAGSTWYMDMDADGFGDATMSTVSCVQPTGYVLDNTDCNDAASAINPGAGEVCNDVIDNNCNGVVDEGVSLTYYADTDGDGFGSTINSITACSQPSGYVTSNTDCNDNLAVVNPAGIEVCGNGIDEDCSGADATCGTPGCTNVNACNFDPLATIDNGSCVLPEFETCDGIDNDCDGTVDDGVSNTYYADVDGDGLGNLNNTIQLCSLIPGFVSDSSDCDDTDSNLLGPGFACDNGNVLDTLDTFQADCSCQGLLFGCTDMVACNYDENATYDDSTCTYSSFVPSSIEGDSLVLPFTQAHQYSYPDTIPGLSFQWTLNALGVFIPNSSIDTSSVVTVFWSNATSTIPEGLITLTITDNNCGPNTTFTLTYNVVFDTTNYSVGEAELGQLVLWPNPSRGEVSVDVPEDIDNDYEILVVDLLGQVVYSEKAQQESIWKGNLNLSSGIYILKLVADNKLYTVPLIIEN